MVFLQFTMIVGSVLMLVSIPFGWWFISVWSCIGFNAAFLLWGLAALFRGSMSDYHRNQGR